MSEVAERVARALCAAAGRCPDQVIQGDRRTFSEYPIEDGLAVPDDLLYEPRWHAYRLAARASIAAMREPTEAMMKAGDAACAGDDDILLRDLYSIMIEAALQDPKP